MLLFYWDFLSQADWDARTTKMTFLCGAKHDRWHDTRDRLRQSGIRHQTKSRADHRLDSLRALGVRERHLHRTHDPHWRDECDHASQDEVTFSHLALVDLTVDPVLTKYLFVYRYLIRLLLSVVQMLEMLK